MLKIIRATAEVREQLTMLSKLWPIAAINSFRSEVGKKSRGLKRNACEAQ